MSEDGSSGGVGFGRIVIARSGGFAGLILVWDLDIDASSLREEIGSQVTRLQWPSTAADGAEPAHVGPGGAGAGGAGQADRFVYEIESRYGRARLGETELTGEWRLLVDTVRQVAEPQRRTPGAGR